MQGGARDLASLYLNGRPLPGGRTPFNRYAGVTLHGHRFDRRGFRLDPAGHAGPAQVLLAQLTNQNPLKPMENQDFIGQIAQFSSLEQSRQTYAKLDQLVTLQSTLQSVGLIGKTVDAQSPTGSITGTVTALSLASGTPTLSIRTSSGSVVNDVSLGSVSAIR